MIFLVLSRAVYQQETVSMTGFTRPSQLPVASCIAYILNYFVVVAVETVIPITIILGLVTVG